MTPDVNQAEQIAAATAEARTITVTALGLPADYRPSRGSSPFIDEILDTHCGPGAPRCPHLRARPVQVWMMTLPFAGWRCRPCMTGFAVTQRGGSLGHIEEHTCDRCRLYVPSEALTPAVLRQDLWIVVASLCKACTGVAQQQGARLTGEPS